MTVRCLRASDVGAVAALHVRAWRHAYRDILPDASLARMTVERRRPAFEALLGEVGGATAAWVADGGGAMAGFCITTLPRDEDAVAGDGEIGALYVDPDLQRRGTGTALLATATDHLRAVALDAVLLWTFAANAPALAFYARHGFTPDGATHTYTTMGDVTAIRLRATL